MIFKVMLLILKILECNATSKNNMKLEILLKLTKMQRVKTTFPNIKVMILKNQFI